MQIADLRNEMGLSLEAFAAALGLKSRGQAYDLEQGRRDPSIAVALKLETLSGGRIPASSVNKDVALVEQHLAANDTPAQGAAA